MTKAVKIVSPSNNGTTVFLAHGKSSQFYRDTAKTLKKFGKKIIASDGLAATLAEEKVFVDSLGNYSTESDLLQAIGMKPVLPEAVIIGLTADANNSAVVSEFISRGKPIIDLVIIDPSFLRSKIEDLMTKVKSSSVVPTWDEAIEAVTPNVYSAVAHGMKGYRIVATTQKDIQKVVSGIESGSFENEDYLKETYMTVNQNTWNQLVKKSTRYIGEAMDKVSQKEPATA